MARAQDPAPNERGYVLGTHDAEVERLAFQHSVWQDEVHRAWREAGIASGSRVVDVGAGPGFASIDLARLVGPGGMVLAAERSARFLSLLAARSGAEGLSNIECAEIDLMEQALPATGLDAAWCRWVACFVPDPGRLVDRIAAALRPGGVAIFHEYVEYDSYQMVPDRPEIRSFVQAVYESWRSQGGEPDIARVLPSLLVDRGFTLRSARPIGFAARPCDRNWRWPAGFVRTNVPRLVELGIRDEAWGQRVLRALDSAEQDPASIFVTPTVLEIVCSLERR
jgi:SAM-dependent methyltransferase